MSLTFGLVKKPVKKLNPLDKAIKRNPKYDNVESVIDTGASVSKYLKKVEEIKANYRYQQDEIFKRMKITTFVQLLLQVAEVDSIEKESRMDTIYENSHRYDEDSHRSHMSTLRARSSSPAPSRSYNNENEYGENTRRSTMQGVIRGIGELDSEYEREKRARKLNNMYQNLTKMQQDLDLPYLLLDLRTKDEYDQSHIITALNYPVAMLARTMNNETPELLAYKNQPGKIILVYDDDERLAPRAAQTLVERGYDNLFLLSGGMRFSVKKFPAGLIAGDVPEHYSQPVKRDGKTPLYTPKNPPTALSSMSNVSLSSQQKREFDKEDIEKLNYYLEKSLMPHDRGFTSRLSKATNRTASDVASNISTKSTVSIHDKAWKP